MSHFPQHLRPSVLSDVSLIQLRPSVARPLVYTAAASAPRPHASAFWLHFVICPHVCAYVEFWRTCWTSVRGLCQRWVGTGAGRGGARGGQQTRHTPRLAKCAERAVSDATGADTCTEGGREGWGDARRRHAAEPPALG